MADKFAPFVAALGRGPGRSRDLTQDEARAAFGLILAGEADPVQLGAFLMLLRYRGENPATIAGLVEAARAHAGLPLAGLAADLDWPSYGAGRTREAPLFLLAALALAAHDVAICMHGTNEFGTGLSVPQALEILGIAPARNAADAAQQIREKRFTYLPLAAFAPRLNELFGLRRLFGLRTPVNTLVRLLDPADAPVSVDGVFHPPYIETHLSAAELLGRPRLMVIKGGGGEAERSPFKPTAAYLWQQGSGRAEFTFPALSTRTEPNTTDILAIWRGETETPPAVLATIALARFALGRANTPEEADQMAEKIWEARR